MVKEFLDAQNVSYESVVITEDAERWRAVGSPPVPTLVVDGAAHVLQHPSQAGLLLGLDTPPALRDARQVALDIEAVIEAWLEVVTETSWDVLRGTIPVLGRTPLALAVDTSIGIAVLPDAFSSAWFHWPGDPRTGATGDAAVVEYEASVVEGIAAREDLVGFVRPVAKAWTRFVGDHEDPLRAEPARPVRTPRGELPFVSLLEAQRLHAAQHYRQAVTFIASQGRPVPDLELESLYGMRLPQAMY